MSYIYHNIKVTIKLNTTLKLFLLAKYNCLWKALSLRSLFRDLRIKHVLKIH